MAITAAAHPPPPAAVKKFSAPPRMLEDNNSRRPSAELNQRKLGLAQPPVIKEEAVDENNNACVSPTPSTASSVEGHVEHLHDNTEILPWNIVEEPPETNKTELYTVEGSWRLIANQVRCRTCHSEWQFKCS